MTRWYLFIWLMSAPTAGMSHIGPFPSQAACDVAANQVLTMPGHAHYSFDCAAVSEPP